MNRGGHSFFKSAIRKPQSAILVLFLLLLSGCAIGPNYHRPDADIPQQFNYSLDPRQTNSLADLPWWQLFNDPALTNLIQIALTNNYDIASPPPASSRPAPWPNRPARSSSPRPVTMSTATAAKTPPGGARIRRETAPRPVPSPPC